MKNIKGQTVIFALMVGLTIIILALALAPVVSESSERARNESVGDTIGMDCSNESISNFDKAACVAIDISPFYFIGILLLIGGGFIAMRVIFN